MNTKTTLAVIAVSFALLALPVVAAYDFWLNSNLELSGTTFDIDGEQFKDENGEISVKLNGDWFVLDAAAYTQTTPGSITLLDDVLCEMGGTGGGGHHCTPE